MYKAFLPLLFVLSVLMAVPAFGHGDAPLDGQDPLQVELTLYPNPTSGVFYLDIESRQDIPYHVKVVDLIGKEILSKKVRPNQEVVFDLSSAPKGVYLVQINQGRDQIIKRLVIH